MKNRGKTVLAILLVVIFALLSGCQQAGGVHTDDTKNLVDDNDAERDEEDEEDDEFDAEAEYAYRDRICDRSVAEGKFACYFLRSNYLRPRPSGVSTSGDATLLIAPDGTTMLIDTNMSPVTARVVDYLNRLGVTKLDYLMISHPDIDHYGGYAALMHYIEVGHVFISASPDYFNTANKAGRFMELVQEKEIPYTILNSGMNIAFGEANMKVLWPLAEGEWPKEPNATQINGGSLVVKFTYGESSFLFGGDMYVAQEKAVAELYGEEVQSDIVKMNHHGLKTSNCDQWVEATNPKLLCGMVSTLKEDEVLKRYMYYDIPFTLSVLDGTCAVYTSGDGVYDVQVERERENTFFGALETTDGHFRVE